MRHATPEDLAHLAATLAPKLGAKMNTIAEAVQTKRLDLDGLVRDATEPHGVRICSDELLAFGLHALHPFAAAHWVQRVAERETRRSRPRFTPEAKAAITAIRNHAADGLASVASLTAHADATRRAAAITPRPNIKPTGAALIEACARAVAVTVRLRAVSPRITAAEWAAHPARLAMGAELVVVRRSAIASASCYSQDERTAQLRDLRELASGAERKSRGGAR